MSRVACLVFLAVMLLSCNARETAVAPAAGDVPVFIISIDTLRADRLPAYGYAEGSTPHLDALRNDSLLFEEAYAQVPLTLPSHASLFTGRLPYEHGIRNNLGYALPETARTLASTLRAHGYATGGAVSSFVLRKETGIANGFDFYDDYMTHSPLESATSWQRDGDVTRASLAKWLATAPGRNVFGFLHLYEPHSPYAAPATYATPGRNAYDTEISYADAIVGAFVDDLKARGLYDDALVVLLSDHGEGLGDHGEQEHGIFLYREAIRVPLLVKLPKGERKGERVARPVALTDVLPTVMQVIGLPAQEGVSLLASDVPARNIYSESFYPRLQYGWSELRSLVGTELHYIDAPRSELYRYVSDPREAQSVAVENRRALAAFRSELQAIETAHPFAEPAMQDPEDAKKLAALGYVGSTVSASGVLPDPKDKLGVLRAFGEASDHFRRERYAETVRVMEGVLRDDPEFISGWGLLAQAYRQLGKNEAALTALRTQMNRSGGSPQVALSIAELLLGMKRLDEARQHAELAREAGGVLAQETLAMIAIAANDLSEAERAVAASLAAQPDRIQALMLSSQIRRQQKRNSEELALLERAHAVTESRQLPPVRGLEFRRGEALLEAGRVADAEHAFRAETAAFPDHLHAWANLALVVGAQGRGEDARAIVRRLVEHNASADARRLAIEVLQTMSDEEGIRQLRGGR